jgi:hypothetical protein
LFSSSCFFNFEENEIKDFVGCDVVIVDFGDDVNGSVIMRNKSVYIEKENLILNVVNKTLNITNYILNVSNKTIDVINMTINVVNKSMNITNMSINVINITKDVLSERIDGSTIKEKLDIIFYGVVAVALVVVFSDEIRRRVMNR